MRGYRPCGLGKLGLFGRYQRVLIAMVVKVMLRFNYRVLDVCFGYILRLVGSGRVVWMLYKLLLWTSRVDLGCVGEWRDSTSRSEGLC